MDAAALRDNLERIRARIAATCARVGRDPADVALVAVTKYAGPDFARALLDLGHRDLGENRVDHLLALSDALAGREPAPRWHFVGHLQRNKAKKVARLLHALHSLDSPRLLGRLAELRPADRPPLEVYLELRLDDAAPGRSGVEEEALPGLAAAVRAAGRLRLAGVMGLPPIGEPEAARPHFRRLRAARDGLDPALGLSMGMTSDLEVALEEGATVVRVGRALYAGTGVGPDA